MTRMWRWAGGLLEVALVAALLFGARAAVCAGPDRNALPTPQLSDPSLVELGRQRFDQACTYCHGKEGTGGKTRSFKGRKDLQARAVYDTIANGRRRGANIMPPWKNALSETQIWELVAYILSLSSAPANE